MKNPLEFALRSILNYMFNQQIDEGWPENEGLQGLEVGQGATWDGWETTGGLNDFVPDGAYTVERQGKTYSMEVTKNCTRIHIRRVQ